MNEKQIEALLNKYARSLGVLSLKLGGPNDRGKPDRMFLYKGKATFVEVKGKGKKPTKLQLKWIDDLIALGFSAHWIDSVADGEDIIDELIGDSL